MYYDFVCYIVGKLHCLASAFSNKKFLMKLIDFQDVQVIFFFFFLFSNSISMLLAA